MVEDAEVSLTLPLPLPLRLPLPPYPQPLPLRLPHQVVSAGLMPTGAKPEPGRPVSFWGEEAPPIKEARWRVHMLACFHSPPLPLPGSVTTRGSSPRAPPLTRSMCHTWHHAARAAPPPGRRTCHAWLLTAPPPCLAHESHVPHVAAKPRAPPAARRTCHAWQAPRAPPCPAHMCHTWHAGRAPPGTPWLMCHAWHSRPARCMPSARAAPGRRPSRTSGTRTTRSTRTPSSTGGRPCSSAWSLSTTRDSSTRRMRCTTPASRPARPRSGAGVPLPLCHMHRHIFHTQRL